MNMQIIDEDPGDPRRLVPNVEFYITNICNLNCFNCNRFNNHEFKGYQKWSDYSSKYAEWAQHIRLQRITLLGGEPLLNPTICDWIDGINQLWNKPVQILTNGTRLNHVAGLYDRLAHPVNPDQPGIKNWVGISLHNQNDLNKCFDQIKQFLKGEIRYYHKSDPANVNNCMTYGANHAFIDSNNVRIPVWDYDSFYQAAVRPGNHGRMTLHNSDPEQAHRGCGFVMFKCYHFVRGALYKCGPVALFPEFDAQHNLDISDQDRELINSYSALQVEQYEQRGAQFLDEIDNVIPQCKFCPDFSQDTQNTVLYATLKRTGSTSSFA